MFSSTSKGYHTIVDSYLALLMLFKSPVTAVIGLFVHHHNTDSKFTGGWSGGAVLGKLSVPGRPTILITVGQGPTALALGADGGCLDIFTLIYYFSPLALSLWETARYRLKYCFKGPLKLKQPTNQSKFTALLRASS